MTVAGSSASNSTAAGALAGTLEQLGIKMVFGLPGVHNLPLWSALEASVIDVVGVRHEQTAVYAADGLARVSGELGVALTTTGPGAANALGATGEAWASKSPVLIIATDIPASLRRPGRYRGVLHETRDQAGMFAPVVKRTFQARSAADVIPMLAEAAAEALAAPTGPTYIEIPTDFLSAPIQTDSCLVAMPPRMAAPDQAVNAAAELLRRAQRPLIWVGGGAKDSGAERQVVAMAESIEAPVIETFTARGIMPEGHRCRIGFPPHLRSVGELWDTADLVLAIGTDFDGMMTQNWLMPAPAALISVNISASEIDTNYPADIALVGDAATVLGQLLDALSSAAGCAPATDRVARTVLAAERELANEDPNALALLEDLRASVPADTPIAADMCIAGYWVAGFRDFAGPRRLAYPMGWGTLGFGFPASIGMALRHGPTLCVCGDGGFLFAAGELAVLSERRPPLTVLIVDDKGYGMLRYDQRSAGQKTFGVDLATPDFVALAHAFGLPAQRVDGLGEGLRQALSESMASKAPSILVLDVALIPPPTTSPRWVRKRP